MLLSQAERVLSILWNVSFDGERETAVRLNELTRKTDFSPSHHLKTRTHVLEVVGAPTSLQVNRFRSNVAVKGSDCKTATDIVVMVTDVTDDPLLLVVILFF